MGMFGDLMNKIFRHASNAERPADARVPGRPGNLPGAGTGTIPVRPVVVDIESVLNQMAAEKKEKLDWKHSIVDLMKLVGMDSSLTARKALAKELNYTGDTNDSATMNMWLHKEVMKKLAANGGKLPADLQDN